MSGRPGRREATDLRAPCPGARRLAGRPGRRSGRPGGPWSPCCVVAAGAIVRRRRRGRDGAHRARCGWSRPAASRRPRCCAPGPCSDSAVRRAGPGAGGGAGHGRGHVRPGAAGGPVRRLRRCCGHARPRSPAAGSRHRVRVPVLRDRATTSLGPRAPRLARGRLAGGSQRAPTRDLAGVLSTRGPPRRAGTARAAAGRRRPACAPSIREAVAGQPTRLRAPWCPRWWTATTAACPRRSARTSAPPG